MVRIRKKYIETCTLYDLIPLIHDDYYLKELSTRQWYMKRLEKVLSCDFVYSISKSSKTELVKCTNFDTNKVQSIGAGINSIFIDNISTSHTEFSLTDFILYTGGIDYRKNIDNLLVAYSLIKNKIKLIIVCEIQDSVRKEFMKICVKLGIKIDNIIFTGFVTDEKLSLLYRECKLFVFPSWHEGLGLPVIEAMASGAPVIASRIESMMELISDDRALFDPFSPQDMADCIERALNDDDLRATLIASGAETSARYRWERTARDFYDCALSLTARQVDVSVRTALT